MGPDEASMDFATELLRILPRLTEATDIYTLAYALSETADVLNARDEARANTTQEPT